MLPASRPMATCARSEYSEFRSGPLIATSLGAKIQPFAGLAAPTIEGAILAPRGEDRQSTSLSGRIDGYPNALSVFGDLNSEASVLSVLINWWGLCGLA